MEEFYESIFVSINKNSVQIFDVDGNYLNEIKSDFKGYHQSVLLNGSCRNHQFLT